LTERLTLPPLDIDTTLPDFAPGPVSLQFPPPPVGTADAIFVEEISTAAAAGEPVSTFARLPEINLDLTAQTAPALGAELVPTADSVALPAAMPEVSAELQDDVGFAVHLEFAPSALPSLAPGPAPALSTSSSLAAPLRAAPAPARGTPTPAAATSPAGTGVHWTRIEIELRESILAELSRRLPVEVEQIVREQIEPAFADIVNRLAIEARMAIAASLREIIERAVKAELDALRARRR